MAGTYFYIDGLNFYYGAVRGTPYKWVDFEALARLLVPDDDITLVRYFTANVKPRHSGDKSHERQAAFLRAVDANPLIEIKRGHFRSEVKWRALSTTKHETHELFNPPLRPNWVLRYLLRGAARRQTEPATVARVIIPEEKGSDVNLGAFLIHDALVDRVVDKAIVITNDSDLEEPIRLTVGGGIPVGLVNPHRTNATNARLKRVASFEIPLRSGTAATCQMPSVIIANNGKAIHKPREW